MKRSEPWYIHTALYIVIAALVYILIRVAIIEPTEVVAKENFFRKESRARMKNLKEAQVLYYKKFEKFTGSIDTLVKFLKTDPSVKKTVVGIDTLTKRPTNPFVILPSTLVEKDTAEYFTSVMPESLYKAPKSMTSYVLLIDTLVSYDTVNKGRPNQRVNKTVKIGDRYFIEDPDGYGTVGDLYNEALKNTLSWE